VQLNNSYRLIISLVATQLAGLAGSFFAMSAFKEWYPSLIKPALLPPDWVFSVIWPFLYLFMGIAVFLIWKEGVEREGVKVALELYVIQLFLNALWPVIFFGMKDVALALFDVIVLWLTVDFTIYLFSKISKLAMYLLLPYLVWISYAIFLNYSIWRLN
jgi:tryptophan-rich sensory protein